MRIGIIGTGTVATTLAPALTIAGHEVTLGSRDPATKKNLPAAVAPIPDAVATAEVVINATPGAQSLQLLQGLKDQLATKVLLDLANASTPAFDLVYPDSSLGEQLQETLPRTRVVKTMNTASMKVITDPTLVPASSVFVSGDDDDAKSTARSLLHDFGWPDDAIVDLGGIRSARGPEHYFMLFATFMQTFHNDRFNIQLVR